MFTWFKHKPIVSKAADDPYRTIAEVPPQPKVETEEEREVRLAMEQTNKNIAATLVLTAIPTSCAMALGVEWSSISTGVAAGSIFASIFVTIGVFIATGLKLDWFS